MIQTLSVTGDKKPELRKIIELLLIDEYSEEEKFGTVEGYKIMSTHEMKIFKYGGEGDKMTTFPFKMGVDMLCNFVWEWLKQSASWPQNSDSDDEKGFTVTRDYWGNFSITTDWVTYDE